MTDSSDGGSSNPSEWRRLDELLEPLLDLEPEAARSALDRLEAADQPLRSRLEHALAAARAEDGRLASSAAESWPELVAPPTPGAPPSAESGIGAGTIIGHWRITGQLGSGGMGTVYAVERADGLYQQSAALKLLRVGLDDPGARERFARERQILARLEHPAIARLLDGGVAADGRPYLVLERVDGEAITAWCDRRRKSVTQRLELFLGVLEAVDFAHRNLVVHRDVKPSNVLVTESGEVKLLDFGVAKLLAEDEGAEPTREPFGTPLTPQFASPEQITGAPVTTASDVYSLGLLLFELLAGDRPYRLTSRSPLEIERQIVRGSTTPPSSVAVGAGENGASLRNTTVPRLRRQLAGDLDAVVLRALAKEPQRRYRSAAELRGDLEAHLAGRPVAARPDSLAYRGRKFVSRHRVGVAAALGLSLALVAALATLIYALVQSRARLAEANRAEAIERVLLGMFSEIDPDQARGREVTLREVVDRGVARSVTELRDQPRTRADLLLTLGAIYRRLALYDRSRPMLEEALEITRREYGDGSPQTGRVLTELGDLHYWQDDYESSLVLQRRALAAFLSAGEKYRKETASARFNVGVALRQLGRLDEALAEELRALELERGLSGEASLEYAAVASGVSLTLHSLSREEEALPYGQQALAVFRARLGATHPKVADARENVGLVLSALGRYDEAEAELRESLAVRRRVFGESHPEVLESMNSLASVLAAAGKWPEARELRERAVELARRLYPQASSSLATNVNNLAVLCYRQGDFVCAERGFREAVEAWSRSFGDDHPDTVSGRNNLGMTLLGEGRAGEALPELEAALEQRRRQFGEASVDVAQSLRNVGLARLALGDLGAARRALQRSVELSRQVYSERHPRLAEALVARARLELVERHPQDAIRDLEEALAIRVEKLGPDSPLTAEARSALSRARSGAGATPVPRPG